MFHDIDEIDRAVVERLRESISYAETFNHWELAHFLAEVVLAWCRNGGDSKRAKAFLALGHAKEVLNNAIR